MGVCCGGAKKAGKENQKYDVNALPIAKKESKVLDAKDPKPKKDDKLDKIDVVIAKIDKEAAPAPIQKTKVENVCRVWGDCFNPETLTILASLDYCQQKYEYQEVNMFIGEHKEEDFLQGVNPVGQLPTLKYGQDCVIGGTSYFLTYLASSFPKLQKSLYPADQAQEIDSHIHWYQQVLKPVTQAMVKQTIGPKAFGEVESSQNEKNQTQMQLLNNVLPVLDSHLREKKQSFIVTNKELSFVDLLYFFELNQIISLKPSLKAQIDAQYGNVKKWQSEVQNKLNGQNMMNTAPSKGSLQFNTAYAGFMDKVKILEQAK